MCDVANLLPAFRHLTGEKTNICRLCFDVEAGVSLDESSRVECFYYDDTVRYADILTGLGVSTDPSLPQLLCKNCANLAMKAFFFQKLSQYAYNKWDEAIETFNQTLNLADTIGSGVKTAYFVVQEKSNRIVTSSKVQRQKLKAGAVNNINKLIKRRLVYESSYKNKTIICHQCGEKVKCKELSTHMKRKHNEMNYPCQKCEKKFKDAVSLRDHDDRIHTPKNIPCPKCNKMFSTQKILRQHDISSHVPVTCKRCSKQLPSRVALKAHYETHDINQCLRCFKMFQSRGAYLRHIKRCRDDPELVLCDLCKKGFCDKRALKSHLATEHGFGGDYVCEWCKKEFNALSRLKQHAVKHTRVRSFKCEQCGGVFVTKMALKCHIRLHTGEKPYPCDVCGEKFLSTSRRMDHKRRKHLEPRHLCSVCGSKFFSKFCLNKHFLRHKNPQSRLFISKKL